MHPCSDCTAKAIDHAIICPILGAIASGRHKSIRGQSEDRAWERLYGMERGAMNKRTSLQLRSGYFKSEDYLTQYTGQRADANGNVTLKVRKAVRGVTTEGKANRFLSSPGLPAD